MRIIKLFKHHILAVLAVIALLIIQANAELALPNLMSEIVDVGIQQGGIESPVPDTIRADALSDLELFMTDKQINLVETAYSPADTSGIRTYQGSAADKSEDSELAQAMSLPEVAVMALSQGVDSTALTNEGMPALPAGTTIGIDEIRAAVDAGMLTTNELNQAAQSLGEQMGAMGGTIVTQRAISYVSQEYTEQGIDLADVQNSYLGRTAMTLSLIHI